MHLVNHLRTISARWPLRIQDQKIARGLLYCIKNNHVNLLPPHLQYLGRRICHSFSDFDVCCRSVALMDLCWGEAG